MPNRSPADQTVRDQCLDVAQSFVVTAPAGSGKTSLLTQRALSLLACVADPESVLCITFTRKAAAEMRNRILGALEFAESNNRPDEVNGAKTWDLAQAVLTRDNQNQWHLLSNPGRLKITTIDGLCRSVTNQLPLDSGLGLALDNLELPEQAYRQAARDTLAWLEKPESQYSNALSYLLQELDGDSARLETLFCQLLAKRDQWLQPLMSARDARHWLQENIEKLINDQLTTVAKLVRPFASDLMRLAAFCASNLRDEGSDNAVVLLHEADDLPQLNCSDLTKWQALADLLMTKTGGFRKKITKAQGLPAGKTKAEKEAVAGYKVLAQEVLLAANSATSLEAELTRLATLPPPIYSERGWLFLEKLTLLLPLLVGHLKTHFGQANAVDFVEISQAAVQALSTDPVSDVLLRMDYQIQHILIDEFQDTSLLQLHLLRQLTSGWQPDDGRSLFLVGDGMQSCYGFRGAEVGLFLEVRQQGIGDIQPLDCSLITNFRSYRGIVDWVNQAFVDAFPTQDDMARGAVSYSPSVAFKDTELVDFDQSVQCYGIIDEESEDGNRITEANQVTALIKRLRAQYPDDSVAVLVRSRNHLTAITHALQKQQLTPQATDIQPLVSRQAIIDLLALTRAFLNPADKLAWFSFFRAPWLALTPSELLLVNQQLQLNNKNQLPLQWLLSTDFNHSQDFKKSLPPTVFSRLVTIQAVVKKAWQERRRKTLRSWLQGIWLSLAGPASLLDASDLDNTETYWQLLDRYDAGGFVKDWELFLQAIEQLYAAPSSKADNNLQVMTIHKSKGLEFDHVIIPGLDKSLRADDKQLFTWQTRLSHDGEELLLMAPIDEIDSTESKSLYQFLRSENSDKNRYESVRLLYVACTRAVKTLHLLAYLPWDNKKQETKTPSNNTLLASIWPKFSSQMQTLSGCVSAGGATSNDSEDNSEYGETIAVPESWHKIRRLDTELPVHFDKTPLLDQFRGSNYDLEHNIPDFTNYDNLVARAQGTALHQLLEAIATDGIETWDPEQIFAKRTWVEAWLQRLGVLVPGPIAKNLCRVTVQLLESPTAQWILSNRHQQSACEMPLLDTENDKLYIIDRTFIYEQSRWIIDYKTSRPTADESLDQFFARETEHYQSQLENYQQLFTAIESVPTKLALYFPFIDQLHVVANDG